jgi:hypothetical protein
MEKDLRGPATREKETQGPFQIQRCDGVAEGPKLKVGGITQRRVERHARPILGVLGMGAGARQMFCISDVYRGVATAVAWWVGMG